MADYSAYESVLQAALPQIHRIRTGEDSWSRTVHVTDEAEQDFVISKSKVMISPSALQGDNGRLDVAEFCLRVSREVTEFDTRAARHAELIREEWSEKLARAVYELHRRFGLEGVDAALEPAYDRIFREAN